MLLGLLRTDSGTARLLGAEAIDLFASLRGGVDSRRKAELLERFDLDPTRRTRTDSRGNRQKVALVSALASDVELLVLDEPPSGLDPLMELEFQRWVSEAAAQGTTVLLVGVAYRLVGRRSCGGRSGRRSSRC